MRHIVLISLSLAIVVSSSILAQDKAYNPFTPGSCLAAQSDGVRWKPYCDQAQALHAGLTQRSRTASIELAQLKKLLLDAGDLSMWQFLSLSLAERGPYYASVPRKMALMDEIEATLNLEAKPDRFVALAIKVIRANTVGNGPAEGVVEEATSLIEGETNPHLLEMLSSSLIKHTNALVGIENYDAATASLHACESASDAWGNPLMPQRCYNLVRLTGREPEAFLQTVALREEALTCGRDLVPLCNLFRKSGHGKYLPDAGTEG